MEFAEEIREFLVESNENLGVLDQEIVELEKNPADEKLIASVFRAIHTIKGTCGFFGFEILGSITHVAENILGQVREKQRDLTPELVSLVLETVDVVKLVLGNIEARGEEGEDLYEDLRRRLDVAYRFQPPPGQPAAIREAATILETADEDGEEIFLSAADPKSRVMEPRGSKAGNPAEAASSGATARSLAASSGASSAAAATIRVDVTLLDKLMNLVGELVLARNQILQSNAHQSGMGSGASQRLNLITSELQEGVMRTRMQPIGVVWNKLPRVVRDLASELGKRIEIQMEGEETELDKTIIEAIKDPLTHIVRNCCDHGIETPEVRAARGKSAFGTVRLRAYHEGGHVNLEISDDGAGIDPERVKRKAVEKGLVRAEQAAAMSEWEALRLLFLPGFSTAEKVSSISGRGVGMDVVKTNIEKIGGAVELFNRPGANGVGGGSAVKIKIPLTLAIIPGLIVSVKSGRNPGAGRAKREDRFVIPQANLLELVRLESGEELKQIQSIHGTEVYRRRGKLLPLTHLGRMLGLAAAERTDDGKTGEGKTGDGLSIVIVQAEQTAFGLVVDGVGDTQEIVVKALGKQLKALSCYVGATIMGDGKIALILDVAGLARLANIPLRSLERSPAESRVAESAQDDLRQTLLLFSAGRFPRLVVALSLVARIEEFARSRVEYAAGSPVVHYRNGILPLVSLAPMLDGGAPDGAMERDSLQVIVFSEGARHIGLVVDRILDIVEEAVTVKRPGTCFGLLGSAVVGGQITDFLDLDPLLEASGSPAMDGMTAARGEGRTILVVDPSRMCRSMLHSSLVMSGHRVLRASSVEDALQVMSAPVDIVLTAMRLGEASGGDLSKAMRQRATLSAIPVIGLAERPADLEASGCDATVMKSDRKGLLRAIASLAGPAPVAERAAR